jgi:hypothetical protein
MEPYSLVLRNLLRLVWFQGSKGKKKIKCGGRVALTSPPSVSRPQNVEAYTSHNPIGLQALIQG